MALSRFAATRAPNYEGRRFKTRCYPDASYFIVAVHNQTEKDGAPRLLQVFH